MFTWVLSSLLWISYVAFWIVAFANLLLGCHVFLIHLKYSMGTSVNVLPLCLPNLILPLLISRWYASSSHWVRLESCTSLRWLCLDQSILRAISQVYSLLGKKSSNNRVKWPGCRGFTLGYNTIEQLHPGKGVNHVSLGRYKFTEIFSGKRQWQSSIWARGLSPSWQT